MTNPSQDQVAISPLSLPKGGGTIRGMGGSLGPAGPTGTASFTLPLPVTPGRGYAPGLALQYSSGAGNGVFGLGWDLPLPRIVRRTNRGVPRYDDEQDEFLGPDGEVLVPDPDVQTCGQYGGVVLAPMSYQVQRYFPRVEGGFDRIERWWIDGNEASTFWLIHGADGQLHCLGKTPNGRTAEGTRIAGWWLEESLSPTGEHIVYHYKPEDRTNVAGADSRPVGALGYLTEVRYGNRVAAEDLYLWSGATLAEAESAAEVEWLFCLVLDYGERSLGTAVPPGYLPAGQWLARSDPFSGYEYGFETRCHRLCRQVLMYHQNFDELNSGVPTLVGRLLLDYNENPYVSRLQMARAWAYEAGGAAIASPPLQWQYAAFEPGPDTDRWQPWQGLPGWSDGQPFQMVDLFGEGLPGLLCQFGNGWHYREPVRGESAGPGDPVAYGPWRALPQLPGMLSGMARLTDIDGDGRLDWLVAQPGLTGCFTLNPDRTWRGFVPFRALPSEFFHPQAQLADLIGAGLSDLALIGPRSVRLYANQRDGFGAATQVAQETGIVLPLPNRDASALVAFSDLLGSGQQHLVEIRHNAVYCWPNFGRGRFGERLSLLVNGAAPHFDEPARFNPAQLFLADLDGSGANDLIYAHGDHLDIYLNQSGNGFAAAWELPLPDGVRFDRLCQLQLADIDGKGVTSLLLTVPYPVTRHWRYDFCQAKPYLLTGINHNRGGDLQLGYRSSAQFWLDDKQQDPTRVSRLPFAVQTLASVDSLDEISGYRLGQRYAFHYGVYDGQEREFRGFTLVECWDTGQGVKEAQGVAEFTPPTLTRSWYHSGDEKDEWGALPGAPWFADTDAPLLGQTRLTTWDGWQDQLGSVSDAERWWLFRALKGSLRRQEVFGLDDSPLQSSPYSVSQLRYQVRLQQTSTVPVVLPGILEQWSSQYERLVSDPQCQHTVNLQRNVYGQSTWNVAVTYPRRLSAPDAGTEAAYSALMPDLPATSLAATYDEQQQWLRLQESRQNYYQLDGTAPDAPWLLGLPWQQRQNALSYIAAGVVAELATGLSFETLTAAGGLLDPTRDRVFAGQQEVSYHGGVPTTLPALVSHIATAELDELALQAYDGVIDPGDLALRLTIAGYSSCPKVLPPDGVLESDRVWVARQNICIYGGPEQFYQVQTQQRSDCTGPVQFCYNPYGFLQQTTDAVNNITAVRAWDYRFLSPTRVEDCNGNASEVALNASGQVIASWFYGREANLEGTPVTVGFTNPTLLDCSPTSVEGLLDSLPTTLSVATRCAYAADSWMGALTTTDIEATGVPVDTLQSLCFIVPHSDALVGYAVTAWGHTWAAGTANLPGSEAMQAEALRGLIQAIPRLPPHAAVIQTDRYPDAGYYTDGQPPQIQASVSYSDALERILQTVTRDEPGPAYQRTPDGELAVEDGALVEATADPRWTVSGRVEYDNKGNAVRVYQPYFVNDWRYVADRSLRSNGYADTHYYDPLGRAYQVETALKYWRRTTYTPWFVVAEDENDLATDI